MLFCVIFIFCDYDLLIIVKYVIHDAASHFDNIVAIHELPEWCRSNYQFAKQL